MNMKVFYLYFGLLMLVITAGAQHTTVDKEFLYVAHRGASYLAPENTRPLSNWPGSWVQMLQSVM